MPIGSLSLCPKIVWNGGNTTLLLTLPQKLPAPLSRGQGGSNESGSGLMVAYELRRDQLLKTTLRFFESEWAAVEAWLHAAQLGGVFTFYMDKNDPTSGHTCYLSKPKMTEDISPVHDGDYVGVYTVDLELRDTTGTRFDYNISGM